MTPNKTFAIQALDYWFKSSLFGIGPGQGAGWPNVLNYYSTGRNVNFFDDFGKTVRTVPMNRVKAAMENLGKTFGYTYPDKTDFFNSLASEVSTPTMSDVGDAVLDGVKDAGKAAAGLATGGLMVYLAVAAFGVFVLPRLLAGRGGRANEA